MLLAPPQAAAGPWTAKQIHDTVAAIARQPAYVTPLKQSIMGRVLTTLFRWIRDLLARVKAWPDARYLLIAALVLLILVVVGRIVIAQRVEARRRLGAGLRAMGERRDYWAQAAELDAAGNFVGACHAMYIGTLDALSRAGVVRYHASKTAGDYARELRQRRAPAAAAFAAFAGRFDRSVYGWSAPTHEDYVELSRMAETVVPRRAAA